MRFSAISTLLKVHMIRGMAPQLTKIRQKNAQKSTDSFINLTPRLLLALGQQLLAGLVIVGVMVGNISLRDYPGIYSHFLLIFGLFLLVTNGQSFLNVVINADDQNEFYPLPFTPSEIFFSKLLSILTFAFPIALTIWLTMWWIPHQLWFGIIAGLLLTIILCTAMMAIGLGFLALGLKIPIIQHHRKGFMYTFYGAIAVAWFMSYLRFILLSVNAPLEQQPLIDMSELPVFKHFYYILSEPTQWQHSLIILVLFVLAIGILYWVIHYEAHHFRAEASKAPRTVKSRQNQTPQNLQSILWKYHFRSLFNRSLAGQIILSEVLFVGVTFIGFIIGDDIQKPLAYLQWHHFGLLIILGVAIAYVLQINASFGRIALSIEKQDYPFMKTLPINRHQYLATKLKAVWVIESVVSSIISILVAISLGIPFYLIPLMLVGTIIGAGVMAFNGFKYDYKHLRLDWGNFQDLFTRSSQWLTLLKFFVGFFGVMILVGGVFFSYYLVDNLIILSCLWVLVVVLFVGLYYWLAVKPFWSKIK